MQCKKLYISADIEGVAGVVSSEHMTKAGFEYQQAREWMTNEVIAACNAAFDSGVQEIVISDSHGNGQNILLDKLPKNVQLVRSWPRPLGMMEGIDCGQFDAAMLLGYHTGATDVRGVLPHTLSGRIREVKLNGNTASETVISAAIASHFQVPIVLVSGDDAYAEHAHSVFRDIEVAIVKWAYSTISARTLLPVDACELITKRTKSALSRLDDFKTYNVKLPIVVEVDCTRRKSAELLSYLKFFERISATAVQFIGRDMLEVSKALKFLTSSGTLEI